MDGGSELEGARQSMMLRIKCLHCLQTYQDPRQLPCGHSFCLRCIDSIFTSSLSLSCFGTSPKPSYLRRSGGCFLCPTCTTLVNVPLQGVVGFPRAQSVEDVKQSAVEEMSKILLMKFRRRTTGNIIPGEVGKPFSDVTRNRNSFAGCEQLLIEENEDEEQRADFRETETESPSRHSLPSSRLSFEDSQGGNCGQDQSESNNDRDTSASEYLSFLQFDRNRRSRRSNRNTRSNLRPTSEYSEVPPPTQSKHSTSEIPMETSFPPSRSPFTSRSDRAGSFSRSVDSVADDNTSCTSEPAFIGSHGSSFYATNNHSNSNSAYDEESTHHRRRARLSGSRSFSTLDQSSRGFLSTTRRCFPLREKIRRDHQPQRHSGSFDLPGYAGESGFSPSSFSSTSRSSSDANKFKSSSFDSYYDNNNTATAGYSASRVAGQARQSFSEQPRESTKSSRYSSSPDNFSNISFRPVNDLLIIEETPQQMETNNRREIPILGNFSTGSSYGYSTSTPIKNTERTFDRVNQQSDTKPAKRPAAILTEKEIEELSVKYRTTPETSGNAKLVRVSNKNFCLPSAVACLPNKCLAVADYGYSSVVLFDASWTSSKKISNLKPFGMTYSDASGVLYVTDRLRKAVLMYDPVSGERLGDWQTEPISWICGIVVISDVGSAEQLAVLDRCTSSVKLCDVETGQQVCQFGSYGNDHDQFCMAEFLAWDPRHELLLVSDSGNHRVLTFDPRQSSPAGAFGHRGSGDQGELQWPKGLSVDQKSNIYVADSGNRRVSRYTADGCFIENLISPINAPYAISVDYVNDNIWTRKKEPSGICLNVTTLSLQNKAQLFRYSI